MVAGYLGALGRMSLTFEGVVHFRSSVAPGIGPPGEAHVLALNPERETRILACTGWDRLEPGSLNLTVEQRVLDGLAKLTPSLVEDAGTIRYPAPYERIPLKRMAYWYYLATLKAPQRSVAVLVRRAQVPVPGRVELYAPLHLAKALSLSVGTKVRVDVHAA